MGVRMIGQHEIYVVVDIENNGPAPGLHSMLSIGATATTKDVEVATFYRTILPIEGATEDPDTMDWWKTQPEAWKEVHTNAQPAEIVMKAFCRWLDGLNAQPVFVAHPIAVDYPFVSWYLYKFVGTNPFMNDEKQTLQTLDLRSFVSGKFNITLDNAHRTKLPENLTVGMPEHSHNALTDSQGYAVILRNVLNS
jgi:DNA polymerase III alpha subunit (gram-positive type)